MTTPSKMPPAAPVPPLGLIGYQEGAVVSRTLPKRAGGTITLFAFDEGQAPSEHPRRSTRLRTSWKARPRSPSRARSQWRRDAWC